GAAANARHGGRSRRWATQDFELIVASAEDTGSLLSDLEALREIAPRLSLAELGDLAAEQARASPAHWRAAAVARTPEELAQQLASLIEQLRAGEQRRLDPARGTFVGRVAESRIAFLFP